MKRLSLVLVAAAVLIAVFASAPARAQAVGATDIDITLPSIVILHYFSSVDIEITEAGLITFLGYASDEVDEGLQAPAAGGFVQDLSLVPSVPTGDPSAALLTLQNAWAVRAIGGVGQQTQVSIAATDATLANGTATISIDAAEVESGAAGPAASIQFAPPGLSAPRMGNVLLTLDLATATLSGQYIDGLYTITAQNV
jgi:hypothetical protein